MNLQVVWMLPLALLAVGCKGDAKPGPSSAEYEAQKAAGRESGESPPPKASPVETSAEGVTWRSYEGDNFQIKLSAQACKPAADCEAEIVLVAKSGYHVNEAYPAKFSAKPAEGITFKGKSKPAEFSKADGDYTIASPEQATMKVRYQAAAEQKLVPISGTFKLSVCSDAICQIVDPEIELPVPLS